MVKVALIGIGGHGRHLTGALLPLIEQGRCRIVAGADTRLGDLPEETSVLQERGAKLYQDAIEMLDALAGKCDAVVIATGIGSHAPLTCAAAERGFHIHLEKPPAATIQEVDRMQAAVAEAGVLCEVGFQFVWSDQARFIHELVSAGRLGRVQRAVCRAGWPRGQRYYDRNAWAGRLRMGEQWILDGPATNALAHQITNLLLMTSPRAGKFCRPVAVRAELHAAGPVESHNLAAIEIRTAEGPMLYFIAGHCADKQFGPVIEITGDAGSIRWEMGKLAVATYADGSQESREPQQRNGTAIMVEAFLDAVETRDPAPIRCTLADARNFVLALNGAHESSGRIHRVPDDRARRVTDDAGQMRTVVDGIDELLATAAGQGALFSDLPSAPAWSVATEPFDLTDYKSFPQQFTC